LRVQLDEPSRELHDVHDVAFAAFADAGRGAAWGQDRRQRRLCRLDV